MKSHFVLLITLTSVFVFPHKHKHHVSDDDLNEWDPDVEILDTTPIDYVNYENLVSTYNTEKQECCSSFVLQLSVGISSKHQHCCVGMLYNDQTHGCCGNFLYELNSNTGCCNDKFYPKADSICCTSILSEHIILRVPPDILQTARTTTNVRCCGLQLYDSTTHRCCPINPQKYLPNIDDYETTINYYAEDEQNRRSEDDVKHTTAFERKLYYKHIKEAPKFTIIAKNERITEKCYSELNHKNPNSFKAKGPYIPLIIKMTGKCNNTPFNVYLQICCSVAVGIGSSTYYESKLHDRKSSVTQCCGLETYDFSTQVCCNNVIYPQSIDFFMACCGNQLYEFTQHICCDWSNSLIDVKFLPNGTYRCCGNSRTIYNTDKEICCGGTVLPKPPHIPSSEESEESKEAKEAKVSEESEESEECDGTVTNNKCPNRHSNTVGNHICCGVRIMREKESPDDNNCCGDRTYDKRTGICCVEQRLGYSNVTELYKKDKNSKCCGTGVYNTESHGCCSGDEIYDRKNELCCPNDDNVWAVVQKKTRYDGCCGHSTYNRKNERCCDGKVVFTLSKTVRCCEKVLHDPKKDLCCLDKLYPSTDKTRMTCCGDKMMDSSKQICCRGVIKDVANPEKHDCCYKDKP